MNPKIKITVLALVFLLVGLLWSLPGSQAQDFPDVCLQAENIMPNCNFDQGLNGWVPFLETGSADITYLQGGGGCHAPRCPAAYVVTQDHFIGGIYQQVSVTKGANYYANIVWLVFDSLVNDQSINSAVGGGIGRRIGIDPFGGTDPKSANIIWSEDNWRNDCKICNVEFAIATAQADTITVFLRLDDTWRLRAAERGFNVPTSKDQFWIDDIGLKQIGGDPVPVQAEPPTDTPVPPPDTPVPATDTPVPAADEPQPTATVVPPTSTPTEPATEVAQVEPVSPVETPTATNTPLPPPTLTPTNTPSPTNTVTPRPTRTPTLERPLQPIQQTAAGIPLGLGVVGTTVCLGGLGLVLAVAVMFGLGWLYRLGWSKPEDDE